MAEKADYYTSLSRAVARLGYDSFEARGAIYDRARTDLLKRSAVADPPWSDEELESEQAALLDAIRRIEFEDMALRRVTDPVRRPPPPWAHASANTSAGQAAAGTAEPHRVETRPEPDRAPERVATTNPEGNRTERKWFEWNEPGADAVAPGRAAARTSSEPDTLDRLRPDLIRPQRDRREGEGADDAAPVAAAPLTSRYLQSRPERRAPNQNAVDLDRVGQERPSSNETEETRIERTRLEPSRPEPSRREPLWREPRPPVEDRADPNRVGESRLEQSRPEPLRPVRPTRPGPVSPVQGAVEHAPPAETKLPRGPEATSTRPRQRPLLRTIGGRLVLAVMLLGAGLLFLFSAQSERMPKWLGKVLLSGSSETADGLPTDAGRGPVQRAVLFEGDPTNPEANTVTGSALWRLRSDTGAAGDAPEKVVALDVTVPDRELSLTMTIRPDPDKSAISHLIELQFAPSASLPADAIANILGVFVKDEERSRGVEVVGRIVRVAPGTFLLGLSGLDAHVDQNSRLLKDGRWLDIPLIHKDGGRMVLSIEKGETGASILDQVFQ